jgi:succinate dehydrogenase / fumarate reductase cytochrome b subunit
MVVSGLVILAFVIYHLLHFTALLPAVNGTVDFNSLHTALPDGTKTHDVYAMMVRGFQVWWVAAFYLVAQALLFMHLGHGLSAMFQSLGFRDHVWWPRITGFAKVASLLIFLGYASIPLAVLGGLGKDYVNKAAKTALVEAAAKEAK